MRALNFGSLNIDYVYSVDRAVREGETLSARSLERFCGGKGLNQSVALSRAGAVVFHAGNVGSDGRMLLDRLRENGIDVENVTVLDEPSGHAIIQVGKNGQNSILVYGGANVKATEEQITGVLSHFCEDDILFLQNETNNIPFLINSAYSLGIKTVFNPSPFTAEISGFPLERLTWLVVNETEANELTGKTAPDDIIEEFARRLPHVNILLTLGGDGSVCRFDGRIFRQSAVTVPVVDTTAAGDTFSGFFFAALANSDIKTALRTASAASAIAVSRAGASDSIPTNAEVEAFFSDNGI